MAIVCTVIFCVVQILHIRNIYKLEEEVYYLEEKKLIREYYETAIINDKVYPGAVKIIDSFIYQNFRALLAANQKGPEQLREAATLVCDSIFTALKAGNNFDSLLKVIIKKNAINKQIVYGLFIDEIAIAEKPRAYITLFDKDESYESPVNNGFIKKAGMQIGGTLTSINKQTLTSNVGISSPDGMSYRMKFSLYCDRADHTRHVIFKTLPQTLLSVFSIIAMLTIFFFTFSNWIKQRKETELKSDFINTITHEFQTPLTAILLANKTIDQESEKRQYNLYPLTAIIRRQAERLSILIEQVSGTSREKPLKLKLEKQGIHEILEDIIEDYRLNLENTQANITLIKGACLEKVLLDKLHFTSIVMNIISNGIKYNHKEKKEILITTSQRTSNMLELSIKDNGDGMDSEVKKRMFEKFFRNNSLDTSNEPGLGLGLYYTKQCLDAHEWAYEVKSKPGEGSEIIIFIPVPGQLQ